MRNSKKREFSVVVEKDEKGYYVASVPALRLHGEDPVRLFAELCEVVDEVVDTFESEGRDLPTPKTRPMQEVA